jgi:hypothetical protein
MPSTAERREAARRFKERKPNAGAYAIRCTATGRTWVDATPNLDAARNRFAFSLHHGTHFNRALQEELKARGEQAFHFEILEKFEDDVPALAISDLLKEKKTRWVARLQAEKL